MILENANNIKVGSNNVDKIYAGSNLIYFPLPAKYQSNTSVDPSRVWSNGFRNVIINASSALRSANTTIRLFHESASYSPGAGKFKLTFTATRNSGDDIDNTTYAGGGGSDPSNAVNPAVAFPLFLSYRDDDETAETPDYLNKVYARIYKGSNSYVLDLFDDSFEPSRPSINIIVHRDAQLNYTISDINITYLGAHPV